MDKQEVNLGLILTLLGVGFGLFSAMSSTGELSMPSPGYQVRCRAINPGEGCKDGKLFIRGVEQK